MMPVRSKEDLPNEEWKLVPGTGCVYMVSNYGRIKNRRTGCIHLQRVNPKGYAYDTISFPKTIRPHRLVAQLFLPNPHKYDQVNHIDGNKLNNNVENLEWCNASMNQKHAHKLGLKKSITGEDCNLSKLTKEQVVEIKRLGEVGLQQAQIGKQFGVHQGTVSRILNTKTWREA